MQQSAAGLPASAGGLPAPLIKFLLPQYDDTHVWWLIKQYLKSAGFAHTASAFILELGCRGVPEGRLEAITEVCDVIWFLRPSGPRQALQGDPPTFCCICPPFCRMSCALTLRACWCVTWLDPHPPQRFRSGLGQQVRCRGLRAGMLLLSAARATEQASVRQQ